MSIFFNDINFVDINVFQNSNISKSEVRAKVNLEQPTLKNTEPRLGYWQKTGASGSKIDDYILT